MVGEVESCSVVKNCVVANEFPRSYSLEQTTIVTQQLTVGVSLKIKRQPLTEKCFPRNLSRNAINVPLVLA